MEWATEFADYLPYTPMSPDEVEYNRQLIDQFAVNYDGGQYDFSVLACHLVTMRITYYKLWQSKQANPFGFQTAVEKIDDRNKRGVGNYPADFSKITEKNAFRLLWALGYPNCSIEACVRLVDERNRIAHPGGRMIYSTVEAADERITRGLGIVQETQHRSKIAITTIYTRFIREILDDSEYDPAETLTLVEERLIRHNHLSLKDIEICRGHRLKEIFPREILQKAEAIQSCLIENYG